MPDLSQYITRAELAGHLAPLAEIRTMLRDDIRGLHEGQARLGAQVEEMRAGVFERMDEANHRTSKLEVRLGAADGLLAEGQTHIEDVEKTVHEILENGCRQHEQHIAAIDTLVSVGALSPDDVRVIGDKRPLRRIIHQHPRKALAVGGGSMVGVGLLLPHLWDALHRIAHWIAGVPLP